MVTFPPAKINLGLYVVNRREDGYHDLETLFYPIPLQDALEVIAPKNPSLKQTTLKQTGVVLGGDPEDNLVMKAYRLLTKEFNLPHVNIYLHKQIPTGAGLGGGSADASFMLKLLNEKFQLQLSLKELAQYATQLGADCPFFIYGKPLFAKGTGNIFSPSTLSLKSYKLVLCTPGIFVSTKEAFSAIKPQQPSYNLEEAVQLPLQEWKERVSNDFEASVFAIHPELKEIKEWLYREGAVYASMSGAGSSIYGIFEADHALPTHPTYKTYHLTLA